ncbi:unnamed protein product [Nyctereutes procyonoides]|uniref:nucleoside-diphosphate kinase n=1 Tax=Nyctereutes procyonoides TaxID=34880 RepID=A0A811ZGK2_NYCPR|nr:unnamed protein product [Nyctereutes procyonoides]
MPGPSLDPGTELCHRLETHGMQKQIVEDVIQHFERRGFKLMGMKILLQRGCSSKAMMGHTDSAEAASGTIRGYFQGAQREIQQWFQSSELVDGGEESHQRSIYPA